MKDVIARTPRLSFIDLRELIVFARFGRSEAEGAYATCHCLTLPESEPGYYFWKDRETGQLTRRSPWFITKSPQVRVGETQIKYLISFVLPRFCDQTLGRTRKGDLYPGAPGWLAKLDTIVHELYHIDPERPGIRRMERADGTFSANCHGQRFFEDVVDMVRQYVASNPDPAVWDFLQYTHEELQASHGGIVGTTFRGFPSYPQRYTEVLEPQPAASAEMNDCRVEPVKVPRIETTFTDDDLVTREFLPNSSRQLVRKGKFAAA
jgi:hypothetical protein